MGNENACGCAGDSLRKEEGQNLTNPVGSEFMARHPRIYLIAEAEKTRIQEAQVLLDPTRSR